MEILLRSQVWLSEATTLAAIVTEEGRRKGLGGRWEIDLGSAWQGCSWSEEKAPGTAESLVWMGMRQLSKSRKAARSRLVL